MKISDVIGFLETVFPLAYQEEYDNSGLIAGDPGKEIRSILVTLDVTEKVLDEALDRDCNLIISHHPLVFKGLKSLSGDNFVSRILTRAIQNDLALYSLHTNLDNSLAGLNSYLGKQLLMTDISILRPGKGQLSKLVTFCPSAHADKVRNALFEAGAGHIGNYDCCSFNISGKGSFRASDRANPFVGGKNILHFEEEVRIEVIFPGFLSGPLIRALKTSHPYEEVAYDIYPLSNENPVAGSGITGRLEKPVSAKLFLERVRRVLGIPVIRHSPLTEREVSRIALCTGSGSFLIPDAIRCGADAFLTADLKYHDFFEAYPRILLADIGHYESEQFSKDLIATVLTEKFPTFAVLISKTNTNPVNYY